MTDVRVAEETAIEAVLAASYEGWAAGDADAMVADYTEDATAILPGSLRVGRAAIRDSMAAAFAGPLKNTSTFNEPISLRFLGGDAAVVVTKSGILFKDQTEVPEAAMVNATWVLEKRDGAWLIAAYHNCRALA